MARKNKKGFPGRLNKKGSIADSILVVTFLFVFLIISIIGYSLLDNMNTVVQASPDMGNQSKAIMSSHTARLPTYLDGLFMFMFVTFWALVIIASFMIDSHPIFFIFTLIIMIFIFITAALLANSYTDFVDNPDISSLVTNFPMSHYVISHYLIFAVLVGFTMLFVIFAKNKFMGAGV